MWTPDGEVRKLCQRFDEVRHAHELTFSCHKKFPLLAKDRTRHWFLDALNKARVLHNFDLWAYVVMPDHAHAILCSRTRHYSISKILQSIKQPVARQATNYLRKYDL